MSEIGNKDNGEISPNEALEPSSQEASLSETEQLRQQLQVKEQEAKENHDRYLRQLADLENFKKRMAREKADAIRYANEGLARDLLPVLDNLERAVEHARGGGNGKTLLEGIEMVLKGFLDVFSKHGVTQVSAVGQLFDPKKHEAIAHVESEQHAPNTVISEYHKGYYLLDRLLRPALVTVAKTPGPREKKADDEAG
ncbi:MAG: nucleotide exchange factor GrpE [Deltaproteobacteria bacterium]|nr:nucleotide exchange factor GrpE [Deltaproteobacteria bacterium]